ncbi:hypothetical protein [Thiocapsa bogorovii]|uniref:hypothetical protein n=1 Tax=Thiocapsa bogorovii TaxID=521689 RepID=UPI001E60A16E|nr:hypothetical protein [Thiocapsa bogorovii]UHD14503.1 hypothetical protein LT988_14465 [Thiocapsa bogorovii]
MRLLWPVPKPGRWPLLIGYGYLLGLTAIALLLGLWGRLGSELTVYPVLLVLGLMSLLAFHLFRSRATATVARSEYGTAAQRLSVGQRILLGAILLWLVLRIAGLALEVWWEPLFPWDAWTTWGLRARVWSELRELVPFIAPSDWLADDSGRAQTIAAWRYPTTVSLIATWSVLAFGQWNETAANLPWVGCILALALGFYGQVRFWGAPAPTAIVFTWLLLSLPLLNSHVALAGYADLWLATTLGFAFMSFLHWSRDGDRRQGLLSVMLLAVSLSIKVEGLIWALLFLPALLATKVRGRWLIATAALIGILALAVWMSGGIDFEIPFMGLAQLGPDRIELPYLGQFNLSALQSWEPMLRHFLLYGNWHLLSYLLAIAVALSLFKLTLSRSEAWQRAGLTWVLTSLFAFFGLFAWTDAAAWASDSTSINRVFLHFVPGLIFWLMTVWMSLQTRDEVPAS